MSTLALILFPLISLSIGYAGSYFTIGSTWLRTLRKPSFYPPKWLVPVMWTILYIMIGFSAYLIWSKEEGFSSKHETAWIIFFIQMVLNYAWTPLFFGMHKIFLALVDVILMEIFILLNIYYFYQIDQLAAYLLIPYAIWVVIATAINFEMWRLNRNESFKKESAKLVDGK
jgi:benzodiazapine receptor